MRRSLVFGIAAVLLVSLSFGCLKMESLITVLHNGSAKGTVTVGIMESYWNMSDLMNLSFGNFTFIDTENATIWTEGGWVYLKGEDLLIPEENMSIQVTPYAEYTEYLIDANLSELQEEAGEEDEVNLSDPFTQIFLSQMTFDFTIEMPGEIVESNAHQWSGSMADWSYTGATLQAADRLYVKSRLYVPEMLPACVLPVLGLLLGRRLPIER